MSLGNLSKYIDHTLLKNTATRAQFDKLMAEANEHAFFSVCIPPHMVAYAKAKLIDSDVKICSVAGFPLGYNTIEDKKDEIQNLYEIGCDEVDVVLNISNVKEKNWGAVAVEFKAFAEFSKNKTLKVIIESGLLDKTEIMKICEITNKHNVSFLKTSTGFAEVSARLEDVQTIRETANPSILIKASGGIKNQEQALAFIKAGADRLGCSASINIVTGE